jgi:hypothetical protein
VTRWWLLFPLGFVVASCLGLRWLRRRWLAHEVEAIAREIKQPIYSFVGSDEALRAKTEQRRIAADKIRRRAQSVESGAKVSDVLRMVK